MDDEIKTGEMTGEIDESITVEEDFTLLEGKAVSINDDSDNKTKEEEVYEEALDVKESLDDIRQQIKDKLLNILEKGKITDADSCEIELLNDQYNEKYNELKDLANTVIPGGKGASIENASTTDNSTTEIVKINIDYDEILNAINEKADWLYIDEDGQVMLNGEVVPKLKVVELEAEKIKADVGEFKELTAENFTATNAEIENLKANKADIEYLTANYATIENLNATNAEITNLKSDYGEFKNLTTENFTAVNADIDNLTANKADVDYLTSNYATINMLNTNVASINTALIDKANVSDLNATNALVEDLRASKADVADLTAVNAKITNLEAGKADIAVLEANYATIKQLDATNANVTSLQTETANINKALINKANVADLNATNANVTNLQATKADVSDLNAAKANISTLTSDLADITTLVNGNLTSDNIQSMVITGEKFTVADGFIKNAMIDSVNANKINAGSINTNNVTIQSNDGSMVLQGNLQQFKDNNGNVRIQIGKDAAGNFTFVLYDENGTGQLINQNGIQSSNAIADGLIVDSKVADNANIAGSKLDIDSVVTEVNNGSTSIKGTKVYLDDQSQSLDVAFNNMTTTVNGNTSTLNSHTTSINTMNGKITQLISDTTITKQDGTTTSLKDAYNSTVDTVNSHTQTIGSLETNLSKVSTGQNKWLLEMFEKGDGIDDISPITIKDTIGKPLRRAILVDDSVTSNQSQFDNYYLGRATTYVYLDDDYNWETTATSDDGSTIYINGAAIATLTSCAPTAITVPFKQGWNKITWVYNEGIGGDGWDFNPRLTTLSQVKYMNAYPMTNTDEVGNVLDSNIKTVSSKQATLEQNLDGFKQTVSDTYATKTSVTDLSNNLTNNYSTTSAMNSAINQKANEITSTVSETYATKTALNTVDGKFANYSTTSDMNSAINQKANEITSSVSETYATKSSLKATDDKFANYSTTSAMNSAINQKANEITSTVSQTYATKNEFNNLNVGGRNLLVGCGSYTKDRPLTITSSAKDGYNEYSNIYTSINLEAGEYMIQAKTDGNWSTYHNTGGVIPQDKKCSLWLYRKDANGINTGHMFFNMTNNPVKINITVSDKYYLRLNTYSDGTTAMTVKFWDIKLEKGNKATGWSPAPEDISGSITAVDNKFASYSTTSQMNSAINQKANEITSTVSETYATKTALNTVDGKFANYSTTSDMNSAINQKSDAILSTVSSTYATKTSLNEVDGKFADYSTTSAMNTAINQKADSILSTVSSNYATKNDLSTVDGKFANYSTTSAMNSAINQKGDSILSTVSNTYTTKAEFNNLEIGGTNLVLNSSFLRGATNWSINGVTWDDITIIDESTSPTGKAMKITVNSTAGGYGIWQHVRPRKTGSYTLSFYAKADTDNYNINAGQEGSAIKDFVLTTNWAKYTYTYNRAQLDSNAIILYTRENASNGAFYIHSVKLEYGNKATDWTPAPEDINASITAVDNKFVNYSTTTQMNSAIDQKANEINLNVSNTYATKTSVNDLNNNLTNNYSTTQQMNSAIDIAKSGIKLDVSQNYASKHEVAHYFEGENKWKLDIYSLGSMSASATPTKELIVQSNCQYQSSMLVEHPSYLNNYTDNYVGYATTYMHFTEAYQWTGRVVTDDNGNVYLNDVLVLSTPTCQWKDITLNFRVGWNKVEVLYAEGGGGDGWQFDPEILSNPNGVMNKMNCYGQNSTEEYIKANYSTTEQMNSAINIAKDSITSSVSQTYSTKAETNDKINNIKVGGTNFIRNGRFKGIQPNAVDNVPSWATSGGLKVWTALGQPGYNRYGCIYYHKESCDGGGCYLFQDIDIDTIGRDTVVTLSFDAWREGTISEVGCNVEYFNADKSSMLASKNLNANDFNGHRSYTFVTLNDVNAKYLRVVFYYISANGATGGYLATIGNVKLEKGNKDTDWSPAPQDVDASIEAVDGKFVNYSTIQQMNSAIDQKANEITSSVSSTYSTKAETSNQIDNLQGQINNTNNNISNNYASKSELQQTTNSITAKFSESGGYNLLRNSGFKNGLGYWSTHTYNSPQNGVIDIWTSGDTWGFPDPDVKCCVIRISNQDNIEYGIRQDFTTTIGKKYTVSFYYASHRMSQANMIIRRPDGNWLTNKSFNPSEKSGGNANVNNWGMFTHTFTATHNTHTLNIVVNTTQDNGHMWIAKPMICEGELLCPYSPHPSEVYDGLTQIDKDGIKVYHGSIDGQNYTHMAPTGFYINNKGEDVFRVDTNGLYLKGNVTITNGSVPSSLLSGQISDGLIGEWIKNGATNGSNAKATLDNSASGWDNTKLIVDTGHTNWDNAKATLDNNAGKWNSTTDRVNGSSAAWDNAYHRVVDWAYGSVGDRTTINGGLLQTNTVTTQHLAIGDFNNYSQLVPGHNLSNRYGYVNWGGGGDHFFWACPGDSQYLPFTINETVNPFKQGDKVGFKFEAYVQTEMDVTIGVWFYSDDYASTYMTERTAGVHIYPGWNGYSAQVTIDCNETKWARSVAIMIYKGADKYLEVRNVVIARMTGSVMIEDGAITASKISAGAVTADKINVTDLSALNASVGGFHIYSGKLVGTGGNGVGMSGNAEDWAFWAGSNTGGNAPFHVGHEGNLYATQAHISGTITASTISGSTINGTNINSDSFVGDMLAIDGVISAKSLQVEDIDNAKYPGAVTADFKLYVSTSGNDDSEIENGATFKTFNGLLDKLPKNLNGHEVRIEMSTDITENVDFKGFFGGKIRLYMKGHTLYGYVVSRMGSARINICSGYIGNASDTSNGWGKIHPSKGYAVSSYTTTVTSVDQGAIGLYNIDVYGADNYLSGSTTKLGVAAQDWGTAYLNGVSYYGCNIGARANAGGRIHDALSYNVCTKYGFYATTGGYITLAGSEHSGGKSKNYHEADAGKVIVASGATFASGEASTPGGTAPVVPTTKTITIKSTYGDTYRSSVYNNWKKDGTVRQGDYGYGDCNGCWFFGDAFSDVEGKAISKVTIKITRNSGGKSSAVGLVVKSHGYSGRPSGAPTYRTTAGTLSLATGATGTLTITNSTILNEIKSGAVKGFGIQSTYDSNNYAVCSGSCTVKITYTE